MAVKTKEPKTTVEKTQKTNRLRTAFVNTWERLYKWNYALGMYAIRFTHRTLRYLKKEIRPMKGYATYWLRKNFADRTVQLRESIALARARRREAFSRPHAAFKSHPIQAIRDFCKNSMVFVKYYPLVAARAVATVMPLIAVAVLLLTVQYWTSATFGIRVEYEGVDVGCISDESTYRAAANLARERVHSENGEFTISNTPTLQLKLMHTTPLLDANALCDEILRTKGDAISQASGLYVDGKFIGSMESREALDGVLNDIKSAYCTGDKNERAEFMQEVTVTDGLFLTESVVSAKDMKAKLTAQAVVKKEYTVQAGDTLSGIARKLDMTVSELRAMNTGVKNDVIYAGQVLMVRRPQPFLRVKVVRTIQYTEKIPYSTEKEYDSTKYVTYEKVKVKGVEGSQDVVAEVTYVDGVEQGRTILSIDVKKQPTNKVVVVGTKKVYNSSGGSVQVGDGVTTGSMMWPVPICHNMSRGYGYGHYALDICNGPVTVRNKPFIAADGGTVVFAGWSTGGYGYMVRIQHANGLQTLYAHCNALYVVTGQKVTKGQILGLIGSTGRSSGPHLHFEVIRNGSRVNPLLYVKR